MLDQNFLVKKSTPLIYAQWANLGVRELKILEVYLSRIDINGSNTCVRFTRKEFAELLGYADYRNLKTKVFDERLAKFLSQQIKIDLEDGKGYHRFNLFSDAKCYLDKEQNISVVDIDCNQKLKSVFIELADKATGEGYRYISYKLKNTKNMESEYSVKLYTLLLDHAWGNYKWIVNLDELRNHLGALGKSYESFKYFNHYVLKKAQDEINKLTDIEFDYEKITKGRKTTGIIFHIKKFSYKNNVIDAEYKEVNDKKDKEIAYENYIKSIDPNEESGIVIGQVEFYASLLDYRFNYKQTRELMMLVEEKAREKVDFMDGYEGLKQTAAVFLKRKLNSLANKKIAKSEFGYLKDMIIKDYD